MRKLLLAVLALPVLYSCTSRIAVSRPEVFLTDVRPGVTEVSFVVSADNADDLCYIVMPSGDMAPSAADVLGNGVSAVSGDAVTVRDLSPSSEYIIYAAAEGKGGFSEVVSCIFTTNEDSTVVPEVSVTPVSESYTGLTFSIGMKDCDYAVYMVSEELPDLEMLVSKGTEIKSSGEYEAEGLKEGTLYYVVAVGFAGSSVSDMVSVEMTTKVQEISGPVEFTGQVEALYLGDTHGTGNGEYFFVLTDGTATMDFSLFQLPPYMPDMEIHLPERTYKYAKTYGMNTFDPEKTRFTGPDKKEVLFSDGTITVTMTGLQYDIVAEMTTEDGEDFSATYSGRLDFVNMEEEKPGLPQIGGDIDGLVMTRAIAKYYNDSETSDNCIIHLYDVEPKISYDSDYLYSEGNMVCLDLGTPVSEFMQLADGTYTFGTGECVIYAGYEYEFMGSVLAMGSYVESMDANLDSSYGYLTEGSVTVSKSGEDYSISFDLETDKGYSISGTYEGVIEMIDKRY